MAENDESKSLFQSVFKGILIVVLILLPLKVAFHPHNERPEVVCGTVFGIADFLWIDIAGTLIFMTDAAAKVSASTTLISKRDQCKNFFTRTKYLNTIPKLD